MRVPDRSRPRNRRRRRPLRTVPVAASKNSRSSAPQSSRRGPRRRTSGRWLSRRSRTTSHSEPTAPALGSKAPNTSRSTRESTTAPAHIVHGSRVTTRVQPVEPPRRRGRAAASRSATTSACAVGSWSRLAPVAPGADHGARRVDAPPPRSGTSDVASAARASARASRIAGSHGWRVRRLVTGPRRFIAGSARTPTSVVVLPAEAELRGDVGEHLVGVEVEVVEERTHVHRRPCRGRRRCPGRPRAPGPRRRPGSGRSRWSTRAGDRPVGRRRHVGEQQPDLVDRAPAPAGRSPRRSRPGRATRRRRGSGAARSRSRRGRRPGRRRSPRPARRRPRGRRPGRSRRRRALASNSSDMSASSRRQELCLPR